MEEKIKKAFLHIFYSCDMNDDDAKELNNLEQELLKEAKKQALIIASVGKHSELLFDFFMWFRENGEKYMDHSVEKMIDMYLKSK